jgi:tetratricopeptide (TPR) repeat protein
VARFASGRSAKKELTQQCSLREEKKSDPPTRLGGRAGEAEQAYTRAVTLAPTWPIAHFNLANALKDQNRNEEAVAEYQAALELDPPFKPAIFNNMVRPHRPGSSVWRIRVHTFIFASIYLGSSFSSLRCSLYSRVCTES